MKKIGLFNSLDSFVYETGIYSPTGFLISAINETRGFFAADNHPIYYYEVNDPASLTPTVKINPISQSKNAFKFKKNQFLISDINFILVHIVITNSIN
jgi:hypothetical protein